MYYRRPFKGFIYADSLDRLFKIYALIYGNDSGFKGPHFIDLHNSKRFRTSVELPLFNDCRNSMFINILLFTINFNYN